MSSCRSGDDVNSMVCGCRLNNRKKSSIMVSKEGPGVNDKLQDVIRSGDDDNSVNEAGL